MNYRIILPTPKLKPFVRYFWMLKDQSPQAVGTIFHTLVDDSSGIIFQQHEGKTAFQKGGVSLPTAFFYGQSTRPTTTCAINQYELIGVHFHPFAINALFGIDAYHLADQTDDFDLLKIGGFDRKLRSCCNMQERLTLLQNWLLQRLDEPFKQDHLVLRYVEAINQQKGNIHIGSLLKMEPISERQLERRFKTAIGIPPKLYIRIIRFREALRLLKEKQYTKLSDIAFDLNYADQSHFIRDIREFSGYTPSSLSEDVRELFLNLHIKNN